MVEHYLPPKEITQWLNSRETGDREALTKLFSALYSDLKRRAHFALRRGPSGATLNTTGLVNEAYLRLSRAAALDIEDRDHFFALASKAMRWVVMDYARARKRQRRGGDAERVTYEESLLMSKERAEDLLVLDQALNDLLVLDRRLAEVVEFRFFGGLSAKETALVLGISVRTVKRDWQAAKAFLAHRIGQGSDRA